MEQGSDQWLQWREKGLGGSDVAVILGISPFTTPLQLYKDKLGIEKREYDKYITDKGHYYEGVLRTKFEMTDERDFPPVCMIHKDHSHRRVSLDGWDADTRTVLEIKLVGKDVFKLAKNHQLPEYYMAQMQYQMDIAEAREGVYLAGIEGADQFGAKSIEDWTIVIVKPDAALVDNINSAVDGFWFSNLQKEVPPPLSHEDTLQLDSEEAIRDFKTLKVAKLIKDKADKENKDAVTTAKLYLASHSNVEASGVQLKLASNGSVRPTFKKD